MVQGLNDYIGFVYMWLNMVTSKKYIGLHFGKVDDGYTGSGLYFQKAVKKYGIENFRREILYFEYVSRENLYKAEFDIINRHNAVNSDEYYNLSNYDPKCPQLAGSCTRKRSDESRMKQSESLKGRKLSPEHRMTLKKNNGTTGKHYYNNGSEEGRFLECQQPDGWIKGRLDCRKPSTKGMKRYTNGIEEGLFYEGDQPNGWTPGRCDRHKLYGSANHFYGKKHSIETINKIKEKLRANSKKNYDRR